MPRPASPFPSRFHKVAAGIAGALISAGCPFYAQPPLSQGAGFAFFTAALAYDGEEGQPRARRSNGQDGDREGRSNDKNGQNGQNGSGNARDHGQGDSHFHGKSQGDGQTHGISYDASRNMMKLHLKLGAAGSREGANSVPHLRREHESPAWHVGAGAHPADHEKREMTNAYLRNIEQEGWKDGRPAIALEKSVNPVAVRYQSTAFIRGEPMTIVGKTKFAIAGLPFLPGEVLAVGLDKPAIERAEAMGFKADQELEASGHGIVRLSVPSGMDAVRGQELLSKELPGHRFELNKVYRLYRAAAREDAVTLEKNQPPGNSGNGTACALNRCFAKEVIGWKDTLSPCARGLKVGVIDTGIDQTHPAFTGRNIHSFDFTPDGRYPAANWHGTAVLSLLAGNPLSGTPGLIPEAEFFAANIFYADERGEMAADTLGLLKALDWMNTFGVKLINMSFSGPSDGLVAEAVERMSENGVIFVAAAGNGGPLAEPGYPAAYPQVVAVTAVTKDLRNYRYANRGSHIDVSAPGVDIWTAAPGGRGAYHSGTSFAAPYVTAVLAIEPGEILNQEKADLLDSLAVQDLGEQGRDPVYGRGLLLAPAECTPPPDTVASAAE